jgi:hypothetical protein
MFSVDAGLRPQVDCVRAMSVSRLNIHRNVMLLICLFFLPPRVAPSKVSERIEDRRSS